MKFIGRLIRPFVKGENETPEETMETYEASVRGGNKQTFDEFMEELRKEWFEEMAKNV